MDIVAGRDFTDELSSDSTEAFILNESAVAALGWDEPADAVGSRFIFDGNSLHRTGVVVGVVKDFHFESIRERIAPLVLFIMPDRFRNLTVRIAGVNLDEELAYLERIWDQFEPNRPFAYSFIDQNFGALYTAEQQLGEVVALFAGLAVVIACLGLLGLAAFVTERRKKEIGVRKALGASVASIVFTLTRGFLNHVALAIVVALPATYLLVRWWLGHFAYHVDFNALLFLAGGLGLAVIAFASVGYQSIRSATANPVASLRDE
jgi:putative ABC transport system permease protein